jgi:GSH-dependent disulfide-bond oxidoreductase
MRLIISRFQDISFFFQRGLANLFFSRRDTCNLFQMAGVGPMFGQLNHFKRFAPEKIPYAIERYEKETLRIYGVLDKQLQDNEFICGNYSIADVATYPWVAIYEFLGLTLDNYPNLKRWVDIVQQRPAVQRGMQVP